MSKTLYTDLILDTLKSKSSLATDANGKIIEGSGGAETDPIVGAVNGIVKADGAGNISAATAGVDYVETAVYPDSGIAVSTGSAWGTSLTAPSGTIVGTSDSQTLTNKRITKRIVQSFGSGTSITPTGDTADIYEFSTDAVAGTLTVNAPTGTPTDGQGLLIRVKTTNTQTYSWNAAYRAGVSLLLPSITSGSSLTDYIAFIWNSADSKWDITGVSNGH